MHGIWALSVFTACSVISFSCMHMQIARSYVYKYCTHKYSYMVSEANVTDAFQFLIVLGRF